jgi:hypothetical protein
MRPAPRSVLILPLLLGLSAPALAGDGKLAGPGAIAPGGPAGGKPYAVKIDKVSAQKGQPATAQVIITPAKGWHLNKDFPTSLKLNLPAGVTANKAALTKADAKLSDDEGRFEVVLTSNEAGKKSVPGDLRFAVCTDTTCDPQRSAVTIEMEVK